MKKILVVLLCVFAFFVCGCSNQTNDIILENISDLRVNYFEGKGENYFVDLSSGYREEVFAYDGVSGEKLECGVLSVTFNTSYSYSFISGELIIDDVLSEVVLEKSPFEDKYAVDIEKKVSNSSVVSFKLKNSSEMVELKNTSSSWAVDYEKAVKIATDHLYEDLEKLFFNGKFNGECYLKIVAKEDFEKKFWYFSCVDKAQKFVSVLIDVESGEVFDN